MKLGLRDIHIRDRGRTLVRTREFGIERNAVTFLFGESGIGKSMLSRAVYGLLDPSTLEIESSAGDYARHLATPVVRDLIGGGFFVFQEPSSHLNSLMTLSEQLNEGSLGAAGNQDQVLGELWGAHRSVEVQGILDLFPKPHRPSGGEKQRLLLAMAFKKLALYRGGPGIFVFDEPTGSLDDNFRNVFLKMLFERFAAIPFTALIITHDYSIISEVMQSHPRLLQSVAFRELYRMPSGEVALRDFSPDRYLGWLEKIRGNTLQRGGDVVLKLKPRLSIFGRNLEIYRDAGGGAPAELTIRRGEIVYLKAPSGTGKTTVAKIIMGLFRADQANVNLAGMELGPGTPERTWEKKVWGRKAGMVFQHADESLNLEASVAETFKGLPLASLSTRSLKAALKDLFEEEITSAFLRKKVGRLSGGQKQRLNLLRTLILAPPLVILDEPLNGLDFESIKKVLSMLERMAAKGCGFLMISHNEEIFESYVDSDNIYHLKQR